MVEQNVLVISVGILEKPPVIRLTIIHPDYRGSFVNIYILTL